MVTLEHSRSPRRVLLAEDDTDIRLLVATVLRADGHQVTELVDGLQLFNEIGTWLFEGRWQPDVIISDLLLPSFTGLEVLGSVHRVDLAIPFIVITAYGDDATRAEARRLGAVAIFDKPLDMEALRAAVAHAADQAA